MAYFSLFCLKSQCHVFPSDTVFLILFVYMVSHSLEIPVSSLSVKAT